MHMNMRMYMPNIVYAAADPVRNVIATRAAGPPQRPSWQLASPVRNVVQQPISLEM